VSGFYHDRSRELQDRFDTRRLADRIEQRLVADRIGDADKAFIESLDMFFLATADADNQPTCSYKGGSRASCASSIRAPSRFRPTTATACSCQWAIWRATDASACFS
jgi:hypothetical protein